MIASKVLFSKDSCTKCGEQKIHQEHRYSKNLGYCQDCAELLNFGKNRDIAPSEIAFEGKRDEDYILPLEVDLETLTLKEEELKSEEYT